jgi:hypothetical protein
MKLRTNSGTGRRILNFLRSEKLKPVGMQFGITFELEYCLFPDTSA